MAKIFKAISSGLSVTFLYVLVVFITPIILLLLESNVSSNPTIFGLSLYNIEVEETTFTTEATFFGICISFLIGLIIHYAIQYLFGSKKSVIE
ncbi:hypothetical protein [Gracilibacillus lacisalsi]|uniref:hypothetical protein n=1 Tax=Gracilibacillus lacisalsi TaxID=393087 RepID=UPI00035C85B4|nr:hypothetical protein [Gracilibacillus lacisalsi]